MIIAFEDVISISFVCSEYSFGIKSPIILRTSDEHSIAILMI